MKIKMVNGGEEVERVCLKLVESWIRDHEEDLEEFRKLKMEIEERLAVYNESTPVVVR